MFTIPAKRIFEKLKFIIGKSVWNPSIKCDNDGENRNSTIGNKA